MPLHRWEPRGESHEQVAQAQAQALYAARHTDAAAAEAWADRMASLRGGCGLVVDRLEREGLLAEHLDADRATDLMWALASVHVWEALTGDRDWTSDEYRDVLSITLRRALTDRRGSGA